MRAKRSYRLCLITLVLLLSREEPSHDGEGEGRERDIQEVLKRREIHEPQYMGEAMRAYLDIPINEALKSDNPFIKALAIVDRRVGRRTIEKLEIDDCEHSLVKAFYELRLATIPLPRSPDSSVKNLN